MVNDNQVNKINLRKLFGALKDNKIDAQKYKDEIREEEKRDFERMDKYFKETCKKYKK